MVQHKLVVTSCIQLPTTQCHKWQVQYCVFSHHLNIQRSTHSTLIVHHDKIIYTYYLQFSILQYWQVSVTVLVPQVWVYICMPHGAAAYLLGHNTVCKQHHAYDKILGHNILHADVSCMYVYYPYPTWATHIDYHAYGTEKLCYIFKGRHHEIALSVS